MKRLTLLLTLAFLSIAATWSGSMSGGSAGASGSSVTFVRTSGLLTNVSELGNGSGANWTTITGEVGSPDLGTLAGFAQTFDEDFVAGEWSDGSPNCAPDNPVGGETYDLSTAGRSIWTLALDYAINDDTTSGNEARTQILNFITGTGYDDGTDSRANQCALDLSESMTHLLESAWLLEDKGLPAWTIDDRIAVADWIRDEAFPVISWAAENGATNWTAEGLSAVLWASVYVDGYVDTLTLWDDTTASPSNYYDVQIPTTLLANYLDGSNTDTCTSTTNPDGIQSTGALPEEMRRSGTSPASCNDDDMEDSACTGGSLPYDGTSDCGGTSGAHFYQQKASQALVKIAEGLFRLEGDTSTGYALTHSGTNEAIYDALLIATTSTGGSSLGDFQDFAARDAAISAFHIAGARYSDQCMIEVLRDTTSDANDYRGGASLAWGQITHYPGVAASAPAACGGVAFQDITGSAIASYSSTLPYTYVEYEGSEVAANDTNSTPLVDWSGWTAYDVTTIAPGTPAAGTTAVPSGWGCSAVDVAANDTNSGVEMNCIWDALLTNAVTDAYLYLPNGTYRFHDSSGGGNSAMLTLEGHDTHGILGESEAGVTIQMGNGDPYDSGEAANGGEVSLGLILGQNVDEGVGAAGTWTGGYTRGTDNLNVGATSVFSVGDWVILKADPSGTQYGCLSGGSSCIIYRAKVAEIVSAGTPGVIRIDRPLPDDFDSGGSSQTINVWDPGAEFFFLENFTITYTNPDHQKLGPTLVRVSECAYCHVKNVTITEGYATSLLFEGVARNRVEENNIDSVWDKPFNAYAIWLSGSSDSLVMDNLAYNYPQGYLCSGYGQGNVFAFNAMVNPEPNEGPPTGDSDEWYDVTGNDTYDEGHTGHGTTVGSGFMHCSNNAGDVAADHGSTAGCRGTRAARARFSFFIHNNPCSNTTIVRDRWESGLGTDNGSLNGPGNNNFVFGVTAIQPDGDQDAAESQTNGEHGRLKDVGGTPRTGYENDWIWINNNLRGLGWSTGGFDNHMNGTVFDKNVLRSTCYYDGGASPITAIDDDCLTAGADDIASASITWIDMDVSRGTSGPTWLAGLANPMPTAPGFGSWIVDYMTAKGGSGTFPWSGADMGAYGGATANCNPAYERYYGACPGTGDPAP